MAQLDYHQAKRRGSLTPYWVGAGTLYLAAILAFRLVYWWWVNVKQEHGSVWPVALVGAVASVASLSSLFWMLALSKR